MIRVSLYGDGQVNRNVASIARRRSGVEVAGPFDRGERAIALESGADVVVIATTSFLAEVGPDIRDAVRAGSNVITTAEEAAFPAAADPALAHELDQLAKHHGITVLGAGLNPGLAFDALVLTATGAAWEVDSLRVERVVNLSRFSSTILRRLGIGFQPDEFEHGIAEGTIHGHIGFPQSMRIAASAMGETLDRVDRTIVPIFSTTARQLQQLTIQAGESEGFHQHYTGFVADRPWFEAVFTGHVAPEEYGVVPRDAIHVNGPTPVHMVIEPGFDPQISSAAVVANSFARVVDARAGWLTVADLPPATPTASAPQPSE